MADIKKNIDINITTNNAQIQSQFESLRGNIAEVEKEIDDLSKAFGENSAEADMARKSLADLNYAYDELTKSATDTGASFEQVYGQMQPLTTKLGEAEDRMYQLALAGKQNTQEFKDLQAAAGNYRKTQVEVDQAVDAASKTFGQKMGGALQGVAGAFAIAQGAAGLFGSENENVEKAILKTTQALALVSGIDAFQKSLPDLKAFAKQIGLLSVFQKANAAATTLAAGAMKLFGKSAETSSKGFKVLKGAIAATGIGLLVIAVGELIANFDNIKNAIFGINGAQKEGLVTAQAATTEAQRQVDNLNKTDELLKSQGFSEEEILDKKIEQNKVLLEARKIEIQKAIQVREAEEAQAERFKGYVKIAARVGAEASTLLLRIISAPIDAVILTVNAVSERLGLGKAIASTINEQINNMNESVSESFSEWVTGTNDLKEANKQLAQEENDGLIELENTIAGYENKKKANKEKANKEAIKSQQDTNKKIEGEQKRHEDAMAKLADEQDALEQQRNLANAKSSEQILLAQQQAERDNLEKGYNDRIDIATKRQAEIDKLLKTATGGDRQVLLDEQKNLSDEIVAIKEVELEAISNLENKQAKETSDLKLNNAKELASLLGEYNSQTKEELIELNNLELEAQREKLILLGLTKEQIDEIFEARRKVFNLETDANITKLKQDNEYFTALKALYDDNTLSEQQRNDKIADIESKRRSNSLEAEAKFIKEKMDTIKNKESNEYKALANRLLEIDIEVGKDRVKAEEDTQKDKLDKIADGIDAAMELANGLADLAKAMMDLETKQLEDEYKKRAEDNANKNAALLDNDELSEEQKAELTRRANVESATLEEEKQAKLKEIKKKEANLDFAITVANIIANTAKAIMSVAPVVPLMALAGVTGGIQLAIANKQKQSVLALAKGGMVYGPGGPTSDMVPAMLSNGESVINAEATSRYGNILSAINQSTGGAPIMPRFAAGGIALSTQSGITAADLAAVAGTGAVRAYVMESEISSKTVRNNRIARDARLS